MTSDIILNAAIDGQDWPTAALCILANPCASHFSRPFVRDLWEVAFDRELHNSDQKLNDHARTVEAALKIVEAMEARNNA
jgi:hypothetical protein